MLTRPTPQGEVPAARRYSPRLYVGHARGRVESVGVTLGVTRSPESANLSRFNGLGRKCVSDFQVSIRRDRPNRWDIAVRRRDDAGDALRSGSYHAGAGGELALAQGVGHEDCQAAGRGDAGQRDAEGYRDKKW